MRSIYKGVSQRFLANQIVYAENKGIEFRIKEENSRGAGRFPSEVYGWFAGLWEKRAEKLKSILLM